MTRSASCWATATAPSKTRCRYAVGAGPYRVAVADLNGDGNPDLAVTNYGDNTLDSTVSVLLGNGDGTLQPAVNYPTGVGSEPVGIAVADFNGDGSPDLAVTNQGAGPDGSVGVLLGNGDGTFQDEVSYAAGTESWGIAAADLNGDGNPDLVVTNHDDDTVRVLMGKGDGGFADQKTYDLGSGPTTIAAANLNGDDHPDLAALNYYDDSVSVLLNQFDTASFTGEPDGSYYFHVRAHDSADDWGNPISQRVNIDTTPPVTSAGDLSATPDPGWTKSDTVTLAGSDATSGLAATYYRLDSGTQKTYSASFALGSGAHKVTYWSVDNAGNVEAAHTGYASVDSVPPVTTASGLSSSTSPAWSKSATVTLTPDDATSGVATTYYTLDGVQKTYSAPFALGNGAHTVTYWSVDQVGNVEASHTGYADVDATLPTITATGAGNDAWLSHAVTITITAADNAGGSGLASINYTLDGVAHTMAVASTRVALSLNATHMLRYSATDAAGNVSADHSLRVHIDTVGPTTSAKSVSGHRHKAITLKALVRDNLSPQVKAVTLTIRNSHKKVVKRLTLGTKNVSTWYLAKWRPAAKGLYTYTVTATDLAGNRQSRAGSARVTVK